MTQVAKVFIGVVAMMNNGTAARNNGPDELDRAGIAMVAMVAQAYHMHVMVCCEGSKYAATPSLDSVRIFVAITAHFGWDPKYFDAVTAFLNGAAKETENIPVRFPPELRTYDENGGEHMTLLNKAHYGHPIASLRWSQTRDEFILTFFKQNGWGCICIVNYAPCMFVML